jgi:hypothetical protein
VNVKRRHEVGGFQDRAGPTAKIIEEDFEKIPGACLRGAFCRSRNKRIIHRIGISMSSNINDGQAVERTPSSYLAIGLIASVRVTANGSHGGTTRWFGSN